MTNGFKNEEEFKNLLDNKKIKELPINMQHLLLSIFDSANEESRVFCWRSKYLEKADIKVKINNVIKGISIKTGHHCSMHQEDKEKFYVFLSKIGVENHIVKLFDNFMIGKINEKKVCSKFYIENNLYDIEKIRKSFNNYYIKTNLIIRFLFQGTEIQNYGCEVILHGTPIDFIWATKSEILKYLLEYKIKDINYIPISALNIKCYDRNIRNNPSRKSCENKIQVKWYTIEEDLKKIRDSFASIF